MPHPGDYLKVKNNSEIPIPLTWDGRTTTIKPKSMGLASFEQVTNHFGHPAAGSTVTIATDEFGNRYDIPTRDDERKRVSVKQGWELGTSTGLTLTGPVPDVEFYDQDDNRIYTVAEDPEGHHQAPASVATPFNQGDQLARLKRQVDMLEKQMRAPDSIEDDDDIPDAPTDDIEDAPIRRR